MLIQNVPETAVSLALILSDPDAPNGTYYHWLFWDLDPSVSEIKAGTAPLGAIAGRNSAGKNTYVGPCPPSGTHHYIFTLYALDTKLNLPGSTNAAELMQAMQGHSLAQATLTGLFSH